MVDQKKAVTKKHGKTKRGKADESKEEEKSVFLWGSPIRVDGPASVIEKLTTSELNKLRWQLVGGNHNDRTKARSWLGKRELTTHHIRDPQ